jgi:hypothetical protein
MAALGRRRGWIYSYNDVQTLASNGSSWQEKGWIYSYNDVQTIASNGSSWQEKGVDIFV